jgi:hypothetical protein
VSPVTGEPFVAPLSKATDVRQTDMMPHIIENDVVLVYDVVHDCSYG